MAIRFLSSETIDGALTVNSTVTLNKTNNVINIPSLVDNGKFLQVTQVGNETWEFKCESLSGSLDGVTIGTTPGKVAFDENGQIQSIQLLDVATAGGRLTGFSNRGYLSSIHLEQTATNTDGGYIRFLTAASGTTSGLERFKITETGAFSVGPSGTNYGTSGQVLTSQGNALPTWTTPTTGTITGSGTADKVTKFTSATAIGDGPITFATNDSTFAGNIIIHNSSNAPYIDFVESGATTDSKARITMDQIDTDNATLRFSTEGAGTLSERMRIDENGNVAIQPGGATLTNTRLYVVSADNYDPSLYDGMGGIRIGSGGSSSAGDGNYTGGIGFAITSGTSGIAGVQKGADADKQGLAFFTHPSDTGGDAAVEKMRLDADGNLGIGTDSPDEKLDVAGKVQVTGTSLTVINASDPVVTVSDTDTNYRGSMRWLSSSNVLEFFTRYAGTYYTNNLVLDRGNVGIGTSSPNFKLDIVNAAESTATYQQFRNGTTGTASSDGTVMGIDADGDFLINNQEAKEIKLYTSDAQRFTITSAGDVGIGYSSPSYKLDVNGVTRTRGFLQESNIFEDVADTTYFTNATADQNVDIIIGNISMWGYIEISITGTYSYQSTPGKLTKLYAVGLNSGGTIYANDSRIVDAIGPINANIYLDDLRWDSTASQYRIRVAHIVSTGNQYSIKINAFSHSTGALNLAGWSISGLYTQSTSGLASQYPYYTSHLGIGTTAPTTALSVSDGASMYVNSNYLVQIKRNAFNGNDDTSKASILLANKSNAFQIAYGGATDRLRFINGGGTEQMTLLNGGNVGIGTTSPTATFQVGGGTANVLQKIWGSGTAGIQIFTNSPSSGTKIASLEQYFSNEGFLGLYYNGSQTVRFRANDTSFINGGSLGIGTTTPTSKLDISDAVDRVMNSSGEGQFEITGNGYTFGIAMGATTTALYHNSDLRNLSFGTNETERLTITGGGNVGINITNPGQKLSIVGDGSGTTDVVRITHGNGSHTGNGLNIRSANTGKAIYVDGSVGAGFAEITTAYNANPNIRTSGDVVAYASSDKRFKDNLEVIQNPINKIHKLNGYTFDWNDKQDVYKGKDYGVVAQEVEKVMPELVDTRFDGYKAVKYEKLVPLLIEAIKEQQKQIDRLEEQIKKMSSKN